MFDIESGLPHNRVNRIYLDSKNFLWICTDDGLSRFDGHQFVNYTTADGLPHRYVNAVLETRAGEYWVATDGGLSHFDPRPGRTRFTTYVPPGPEEARHVNALIEETDGSLLLGTSSGLYRFTASSDPKIIGLTDFDSSQDAPKAVMVNAIARDTNNSLWLATNHGLYRRGIDGRWTNYLTERCLKGDCRTAEPPAFVSSFAEENNHRLWIAFNGGFGRIAIDPKPGTPVLDFVRTDQPELGREVRALWLGADGRRWIATNTGLREWIVGPNDVSRFREHTLQEKFPHEAVISIREDIAGNLWIGTRRSGLLRMGASRFQTFGATAGLQLGRDQLLMEARTGQISIFDIGGRRTQVYRQKGEQRFISTLAALPETAASMPHVLQMVIEDRKGAWWFSTGSGLFRFPVLEGQPDLRLMPECAVDRFFEDAAGDLWMSNWCHGEKFAKLARWERRSGMVHDESDRLPPDARMGISAFVQDRAGTIWVGLQHPGRLFRLKKGRFQSISANWQGHINKIFADSKGRLWITSTESGLGLIEDPMSVDPQLRRYTRAQGLSADEVWCITEDRLGRIYAGTAKGVDRLDPDTGRIVHYSTADGLVRGDIRSALRDRNGHLWFASAHGVSKFRPSEDRTAPPSRARITGLRTAGVPFPLSEFGETAIGPVQFQSHQNSLQIDFAATDYRVQTPLRYEFWLDREGRHADSTQTWQDLGTTSTIHLIDLAPGDFLLKVRALTPDGLHGEPASLAFAILQPLWRTWWFQLMCVMAIAGLVYWMRTRGLQQQLAMERVRSHIAMDLHDDIGAGLSRISVMGEALKGRLPTGDGEVRRMLNDIADSSRQLVTDMSDIVWSLDPRRDQIGELASRLRAFGSDLLETHGVEWAVDAPSEKLHQSVPPALRRQLYLIFKEGIHNVAKHADAKKATLHLWLQAGYVGGELTDDGRGITPGIQHGNGIASMRERVKHLSGDFEISTTPGSGTSIRINVPLSEKA